MSRAASESGAALGSPPEPPVESPRAEVPAAPRGEATLRAVGEVTTDVDVLRTLPELEGLRPAWDAMTTEPGVDLDSYLVTLRSRAGSVEPRVFALRGGGSVVGILVGWLETEPMRVRIGGSVLASVRARTLRIVGGGCLRAGAEVPWEPLVRAALGETASSRADALLLSRVPADSGLEEVVRRAVPRRWLLDVGRNAPRFRLELPRRMDDLLARTRPRHRKNLRRNVRVLERDFPGSVVVRRSRIEVDVPGLSARISELSRRTWQQAIGNAFADSEPNRERLLAKAARGRLRAWELEAGGRLRSFWVGEIHGRTLHLTFTGFDADLAYYEPGTTLLMHVYEDSIAEGLDAVDFGPAELAYKRKFGAGVTHECDVLVFRSALKGAWITALRSVVAHVVSALAPLLGRLGLRGLRQRVAREGARTKDRETD